MAHWHIETKKSGMIVGKIQVSGKDFQTGKHRLFCKRVYNDNHLTLGKFRKVVERAALDYEEEVQRAAIFFQQNRKRILSFAEIAEEWLDYLKENLSHNYYIRAKETVGLFNDYLMKIGLAQKPISEITVRDVQLFFNDYSVKTIKRREVVRLEKDLPKNINFRELAREGILTRSSSYGLTHKRDNILKEKALKICELYGLNFEEYFQANMLVKKYSVETIKGHRRILRAIFNEAVRYDWITKNPISATKIGGNYMKGCLRAIDEKEVFSLSEMKLFLRALEDLNEGKMYQKISFKIMLLAGVRLSELCGLKWEDVDFEKSLLHIRRNRIHGNGIGIYEKEPKTKTSRRDIPLPKQLMVELQEYYNWLVAECGKDNVCPYLIVNNIFEPVHPRTVSVWLKEIENKYGFKQVSCHGLRHTYCSFLLSQNVPLQTVSRYMGHSDSAVTLKVYSHFIPETHNQALDALSCVFV